MKIEKVNDHQIRCTLTGDDLANRELKISELAYGSEKAKSLFRDMMQQANFEFGFEAEDIPLMIEAIPINSDCIVLIITKVEDPDEIDTRFSKFSPQADDDEEQDDTISSFTSGIADDVIDLFQRIKNSAGMQQTVSQHAAALPQKEQSQQNDVSAILPRTLVSDNLPDICRFARSIDTGFKAPSICYKNPSDETYHLLLEKEGMDAPSYGRIINIASEYGHVEKISEPKLAYMKEHYQILIAHNAVHTLSQI